VVSPAILERRWAMKPRFDYQKAAQEPIHAMLALGKYLVGCGLEPRLVELAQFRASQINGCAYCLDMHSKEARAADGTEQRLYTLSAWRETPFFSPRDRAALAWTEAVTQIGGGVCRTCFSQRLVSISARRN
jgi:AhpD family alkylhydroperoxidase